MLLAILELPRLNNQSSRVRKLLKLKCDQCNIEWERRWQREVSEQTTHCCSRICAYQLRSKNPNWRQNISITTKQRMKEPQVQERFQAGLKRRNANPLFGYKISLGVKRSFQQNPERAKQHSERMRTKFADPLFKEFHRSRLVKQTNPWWKPWMEIIKDDIRWSNRVIALYNHKCAICETQNELCAHHIAPKSKHPELRYDLNNGLALCKWCHVAKANDENVHRILRTDLSRYESLMKALVLKRQSLQEKHL